MNDSQDLAAPIEAKYPASAPGTSVALGVGSLNLDAFGAIGRHRPDRPLRRSIEVGGLFVALDGSDTQALFKRTTTDLGFTL